MARMRSRGGALHTRPDGKMGRFVMPLTWAANVTRKQAKQQAGMLKRHARKKRRQRDRVDG